jgi:hypothetical protein
MSSKAANSVSKMKQIKYSVTLGHTQTMNTHLKIAEDNREDKVKEI